MPSQPQKKIVLITGCSEGGIGYALAKEYHSRGLRVFATARRLFSMESLAALGIECLELDVTDLDQIHSVRDIISSKTGGKLDILVNNAGAGGMSLAAPALDVSMADVRKIFEVNVFAIMSIVKEFAPLLIASGNGRIVNIGSVGGIFPNIFMSAYAASKAALHTYGNALRLELAPFNIQVITVMTGGVKSNMSAPQEPRVLPPTSLYTPIYDIFSENMRKMSQDYIISTEKYASTIVTASLKARTNAFEWRGGMSRTIWFFHTFFCQGIFDSLMSSTSGLTKLKKHMKLQTPE